VADRGSLTELAAFSSDCATPTAWTQARAGLWDAPLYWLSTVRPDGRPHVNPLLGIWLDAAGYFCIGPPGAKPGIRQNQQRVLTADPTDSTVSGGA
jgi:Pyridoxamine 5'-phosphate oxidase